MARRKAKEMVLRNSYRADLADSCLVDRQSYNFLSCGTKYFMLQGIGLLLSPIIAGLLWAHINSRAPFLFGSVIGIRFTLIITLILDKNNLMKLFRKGSTAYESKH